MPLRSLLADIDVLDHHAARMLALGFLPAAVEPLLAWLDSAGTHDNEAAIRVWTRLGMVYAARNELDQALSAFQHATDLAAHTVGPARTAAVLNLSRCHRLRGDYAAAEEIARKAMAALGPDCPTTLRSQTLHVWANALVDLNRAAEACDVLEEALALNREREDHLSVATTLNNLGVAALAAGLFDRAEQALSESCSLISDTAHRLRSFNYTELGRLYQLMDRPAAAMMAANQALETLVQDVSLVDRAELARLSELNGRIFLQEKDRRAALAHLNRAASYYAQLGMLTEWDRCQDAIRLAMNLPSGYQTEFRLPGLRDRLDFLTRVLDTIDEVETLVPYLQGHGMRVATYAGQIGRQLGLSNGDLANLKLAARLHHVGRSTAGLQAPTAPPPTVAPDSKWHEHSVTLADSVLRSLNVNDAVLAAVRCQHAAYDGSGFPAGLSGNDIPLLSRIISVANAYDSLTSHRPYRSALPHSAALASITAEAGTRFCPEAVNGLVALVS